MRHPTPFPFQWYAAGSATNDATIEPITLTLEQAVALWWRTQKVTVTFSANMTVDGDTQTFNNATFGSTFGQASRSDITTELDLCRPGQYATWNANSRALLCNGTSSAVINWGTSGSGGPWTDIDGTVTFNAFTNAAIDGASIKRRGTWTDINTVKPAIASGFSLTFYPTPSFGAAIVLYVRNEALAGYAGSFSGTLLGNAVPYYYQLAGSGSPYVTVNSMSLTIAQSGYYAYEVSGGGSPVWSSTTGAQILDPKTASVP